MPIIIKKGPSYILTAAFYQSRARDVTQTFGP